MAGTMSLQLCGGGVPAIGLGIAVGGQTVGIAVVVQLLLHIETEQVVDIHIAVVRQAVVANEGHFVQRQGLSDDTRS